MKKIILIGGIMFLLAGCGNGTVIVNDNNNTNKPLQDYSDNSQINLNKEKSPVVNEDTQFECADISEDKSYLELNTILKDRYLNNYKNQLSLPTSGALEMVAIRTELYDNLDKITPITISLSEHDLPVDCMIQIISSKDGKKIAYLAIDKNNTGVWQGFVYDMDTKKTQKIKNSSKVFGKAGCATKHLQEFTDNNRHLKINLGGPCGYVNLFVYDLELESLFAANENEYMGDILIYGDNEQYGIYANSSDGSYEINNALPHHWGKNDQIMAYNFDNDKYIELVSTNKKFEVYINGVIGDSLNYTTIEYFEDDPEEEKMDKQEKKLDLSEILK